MKFCIIHPITISRIIMKLVIILALVAVAVARPDDGGTYDSKYDNFNVDELVGNARLLKSYAHCFLDDGKCTPEGNDFKKWIPEATTTSCGKCSEKQKALVAKTIQAIKDKLPAEYEALIKKHDPENKHQGKLQEFLQKYSH
ncbi:allergen Tha p 1-like [Spodoptera frugiperda]|uniref:Allergen Tha p 1-like n=2 Tax=Obtectomera TaxID=104431 RepID=A0A9R0D0A8_SPOFR|nr:allergen Tha p 1-like [Spodoptera frugiperda]